MNGLWRTHLGWVILVIISLPVYPQSAVRVDEQFQQVVLSEQTLILADTIPVPHIEQALARRAAFKPHREPSINLGFTNQFYWIHFRLQNPTSATKSLLLEVENPHINKLQLFTQKQGQLRASMLTGDHFPFSQRPVRYPHFLFPIQLEGKQVVDCYLWVDKHGEQLQIPLRLWDKAAFEEHTYVLYLFVGFMLGILSLYCIISFLTLLFFRLWLTLYYFLYTATIWAFMIAHTGFGFALLWPNATWWTSAARPTLAILLYVFAILFVRVFFRLDITFRWYYKYTQLLLGVLGVLLAIFWLQNPALGLFKNYWYNPVYYEGRWLLRFMIAVHLVVTVALASVAVIGLLIYRKTRLAEALWVALGFLTTLLSGSLIILIHVGILPDNYITQNFPLITNSLDVIILSVLLANRFKNIHVQNGQIATELAEQRQRNAIQLLEGQIIERKRLSQELHDGISLSLANIRMRLSLLADTLNGQKKEAQQLVEALGDVGQDVRQFSHALSPVMLERYGLIDALEDLIQQVESGHPDLSVDFRHDDVQNDAIHPLVSQTIYQISLELLNNVLKHTRAKSVVLELDQVEDWLMLQVSDDGQGYDFSEKPPGIGLQNIQARVQLLSGKFTVQRQSAGMRHQVELPIQTRLFS